MGCGCANDTEKMRSSSSGDAVRSSSWVSGRVCSGRDCAGCCDPSDTPSTSTQTLTALTRCDTQCTSLYFGSEVCNR